MRVYYYTPSELSIPSHIYLHRNPICTYSWTSILERAYQFLPPSRAERVSVRQLPSAMGLVQVLSGIIVCVATWALYTYLFSPVRSVPGPVAAIFTKFWYVRRIQHAQFHWENIRLHQRYGPVVRYGPKHVSISDPQDIKRVYDYGHEFAKSAWYEGFTQANRMNSLFTDRQNKRHAQLRRQYSAMYSMSTLSTSYETFVDDCVNIFCQRMMEKERQGGQLDITWWTQCYAADAVSKMTFSKRFGFMDQGDDVGDLVKNLHQNLYRSMMLGMFDGLAFKVLDVTEWAMKIFPIAPSGKAFLAKFIQDSVLTRRQEREAGTEASSADPNAPMDFMAKMFNSHEQDAEKFPMSNIFSGLGSNIVAGFDTTAATMAATMYFLIKNPRVIARLREDIAALGPLSSPVTFKQAQELPYLHAIIQEGMRLHSAAGLPLERVVPAGGAELSGHFLPAGTVVGVNPWVTGYSTEVYGADAWEFRPERWLEADKESLAQMDRNWLSFGLGSRNCIGRHISMLEMKKFFPEVLRRFDFEFIDKDQKLEMQNIWFVVPGAIDVRVKAL